MRITRLFVIGFGYQKVFFIEKFVVKLLEKSKYLWYSPEFDRWKTIKQLQILYFQGL